MLFQSLDNKKECYKIYVNNELVRENPGLSLTQTWSPTGAHNSNNVDYAQIWSNGMSLADACPDSLKDRWSKINLRAMAYVRSFHEAKINLSDVCFYDLVPEKFLLEFCDLKNQITDHVFKNFEKPENYDFLRELTLFLKQIEDRELNIDLQSIDFSSPSARGSVDRIKNSGKRIIFNPWRVVTGRLATEKNSFPILTLNKKLRTCLKPQNDLFLELDYNAAELRVLLGLLNLDQPPGDVHEWINKNIFKGKLTRDETKKKVFAWLYNPKARNKSLNSFLPREEIVSNFYHDGKIKTPYGRQIEVEPEKAVNYLIQSTSSDMLLTSAMAVNKLLADKKSFVSFCIHDSIVLDISIEDKGLIDSLTKQFGSTIFGDLKVNLSIGKNFGQMRSIK